MIFRDAGASGISRGWACKRVKRMREGDREGERERERKRDGRDAGADLGMDGEVERDP